MKTELTDSKGRKIADWEIWFSDDVVDCSFGAAEYEDGSPVSQEELDELTQLYPDLIKERWFDIMVAKAEDRRGDR